jgi:hypothetical protein
MKKLAPLFFLLLGYYSLLAQKAPVKFGKINEAYVKMTTHPLDTSADAITLIDYGVTKFDFDGGMESFVYVFERTVIIKVFSKDGLKYGDFSIPFFETNGAREKVVGLKGYTYNNVNGKVQKSKLEKSSIYEEKESENWSRLKISMPDVKEGSVIELHYILRSPYTYNLQTWAFQSEIPAVHSEYFITIPEYFDYQLLSSGYHPYTINEQTYGSGSMILRTTGITDGQNSSSSTVSFKTKGYHWVSKDVPAFDTESYVASPNDYLSKIEFELKGTNYPNRPYKAVMGTWATLNRSFLESSSFGDELSHTGYMKDELAIIANVESNEAKVSMLLSIIKNQVDWNGRYSKYVSTTLRNAWNDKSGSTGDINMMIVAGLRELGFKSDPVLISTRGHGMVREPYAISSQFNSVLAYVDWEDGYLLLDGTDKYLPAEAIPKKCLNGKGWRVSDTSWGWINLNPTANYENVYQGIFTIDEMGMVTGTVSTQAKGYASYQGYKNYKLKGEEDFIDDVKASNASWEIEDYEIDESAGIAGPFKCKYKLEYNENLLVSGSHIYFNPTMGELLNENPFKLENREYPVDYAQPIAESYFFNFTIPHGYSIEELPEPIAFALPNKDAVFRYNISGSGNTVQVKAQLNINKTRFLPNEYGMLKQFYDQAVKKCEEQVVIKKTT